MQKVYIPESNLFSRKENFRQACTANGKFKFLMEMTKTERLKAQMHNHHLTGGMAFTDDEYGFPIISAYTGPTDFVYVPFSSKKDIAISDNIAVMFFEDDYKFHYATWYNLDVTTYKLLPYTTLVAPDHSLYVDMSDAVNIEMIYKSRFAGAFWQLCGFEMIPTASWGKADSFRYCFRGLPQNSVIAVCGMGTDWCDAAKELWNMGIRELVSQLSPRQIIVFGEERDVPGVSTPLKFVAPYVKRKLKKFEKNNGRK